MRGNRRRFCDTPKNSSWHSTRWQRTSACYFTGPAGTGKTVLALEAARRASNSGKKVLLSMLQPAARQAGYRSTRSPNAATVAAQYVAPVPAQRGRHRISADPGDSFWKTELPEAAISKLFSGHADACRFDIIVADEVQDLLVPPYLDVMDLVLQGGLAAGRWLMFGDFERQMLYGQDRAQIDELIPHEVWIVREMLHSRVNCRNTPRSRCAITPSRKAHSELFAYPAARRPH